VLAQAAGFGLLAAVSPTALLVMAVFLSSANPRTAGVMYLAGAALMTVAVAVAALFILRSLHLNDARHHDPRYGLRFGLGLLALLVCVFLATRLRHPVSGAKPGDGGTSKKKKPGLVARITANPGPRTAFIAGLILFVPSATFLAAVQVVATSDAGTPGVLAGLIIVIVLTVLTVWLPLIAYLAAPEATTGALRQANRWVKANGRTLLTGALAIAGVALAANGALGLWAA
jgi:Sap, sulfolipid-1-addressing protein